MADGTLYEGLVSIVFNDGDAVQKAQQVVSALDAELAKVGSKGGATGFLSGLAGDNRELDTIITKFRQLQGYVEQVKSGGNLIPGFGDTLAKPLAELRAFSQGLERIQAQRLSAGSLGGGDDVRRQEEATQRAVAAERERARLSAETNAAEEASARRRGANRGGGGEGGGFLPNLPAVNAEIGNIREGTKDPLGAANARLVLAQERVATVLNTEFESQNEANRRLLAARQAEIAAETALEQVKQRLIRAAEKEAKEREAAGEREAGRAAVQADPRFDALSNTENSRDVLNLAGANPQASIRAQMLQVERARLLREQESLAQQAREATSIEQLNEIYLRRIALERRILANAQGSINQAGRDENGGGGGRSGFFNGLIGGFGGNGENNNGGIGGLLFQAGQAAKFFALYTALSGITQLFKQGVADAEAYTLSVNDLAIALGVNADAANDAALNYAKLGQEYAASPIEAIQGATKFIRSFQGSDTGQSSEEIGAIGARLGSIIQQIEGKTATPAVTADLIGLTKSYGLGATDVETVYDMVTKVAQRFGITGPNGGQASGGAILSGVTQIGDIGRESGYDIPRLAALIASVQQSTGVGTDAAAGDVKRFLGSQDTLEPVFERFQISGDEKFAQRLDQLFTKLQALPADQRSQVLNSLGGARIGAAVSAAVTSIPEQQAAAAEAQGAAGTSADLAKRRLEQFGGAMDRVRADLDGLIASLSNTGLSKLGADALGAVSSLLRTLTSLFNFIGSAPEQVKELITSVVVLTGVLAVARGITNALAGSEAVLAARRQFGAITGLGAGAAEGATGFARLSGAVSGLGSQALLAARSLGPLVAVVASILALRSVKNAADNIEQGQTQQSTAIALASGNRGQGPQSLAEAQKALTALNEARATVASGGDGFGGHALDIASDAIITPVKNLYAGLTGSANGTNTYQSLGVDREGRLRLLDTYVQRTKDSIDALTALATGVDKSLDETQKYFGKSYDQINQGSSRIVNSRVGLGTGARVAQGEIAKLDANTISQFLTPQDSNKGAEDILNYLTEAAKSTSDPAGQQQGLATVRQTAAQLLAQAKQVGTPSEINAASELAAKANAEYFSILTANTQAKIASIKAFNSDTPKTQAALRALVTGSLEETTKAGDVGSTITLLNGVDKAFIDSFRKGLQAQLLVLQSQQAALKAAAAAASAQLSAISTTTTTTAAAAAGLTGPLAFFGDSVTGGGTVKQQTPNVLGLIPGLGAVLDAQSKGAAAAQGGNNSQIKALQTALATLSKATSFAAPDGSDFKFPGAASSGDIEAARIQSQVIPGDPLSQATISLRLAQYKLRTAANPVEYYTALKDLRQAQYDLGKVELDQASQSDLAGIDITDPVAQARAKVRAAQRQLSFDQNRGALGDVIQTDQNNVRQANSDAQKAAFDQQFGDYQTNYDLNRISLSAYLSYLNSQHDYLSSVHNKTRQQVDELNQVDRALKGLTDSLQGQFNLGEIKVPSPYEARRLLAGSAGGSTTTQYVTISINGADLNAVRGVLSNYVGQAATQVVGGGVRKV